MPYGAACVTISSYRDARDESAVAAISSKLSPRSLKRETVRSRSRYCCPKTRRITNHDDINILWTIALVFFDDSLDHYSAQMCLWLSVPDALSEL